MWRRRRRPGWSGRPPAASPGDMVDQRAHDLKGSKDLPANLCGRTHGIHRHQDASLGVPGNNGIGHLVVQLSRRRMTASVSSA